MKHLVLHVLLAMGMVLLVHSRALSQGKADGDSVSGKALYAKDCSGCHGTRGEGDAGPNLTDPYWLHGGGTTNIAKTLRAGAIAKGMISWSSVFSDREIEKVTDYVASLQGSNPPKAKKPDGVLFEEQKKPPRN